MPGSVIPPPLVRGGQQMSSKLGPQASSQVVMPPLVRGAQVSKGAPLGQKYGQAAPGNGLPHLNNPFQFSGWGYEPSLFLCLPPLSLIVLSPSHPTANPQHQTTFQHGATSTPPGPPGVCAQCANPGTEDHPARPYPCCQCPQHQSARQYPTGEGHVLLTWGVYHAAAPKSPQSLGTVGWCSGAV